MPRPPNTGTAPRPPRRLPATNSTIRSASRASRSDPRTSDPPSTRTLAMPRRDSSRRALPTAIRPFCPGASITRAPFSSSLRRRAADAPRSVITITGGPPFESSRARGGVRSRASSTTRTGRTNALSAARLLRPLRAVRRGSSRRTVFTPTSTASCSDLRTRPAARARADVIHFDSPERVAIRPSRLMPAFSVTNGRPAAVRRTNSRLSLRAASTSGPVRTRTPAARSARKPLPLTLGSGSRMLATTSRTPAPMRASTQGGVRPKWQHGSRFT